LSPAPGLPCPHSAKFAGQSTAAWQDGRVNLEEGAGLLHRLTSYDMVRPWDEPTDDPRIRHDLVHDDLATRPPSLKEYADLPVVALPRDLPAPGVAATDALAGTPVEVQPLDPAQLGRILFLGAGVVRELERKGQHHLFRASGSAGARFPLEVYASTKGVDGLDDGVYWYNGLEHALVRVAGPAGGDATTLVVTGIPWRTGWRYAERGWRHVYWDGGTLVSQLTAAAASAGFDPRIRTMFPDAQLRTLVGADGVHEYPIALVTFGPGRPAIAPAGEAATGYLPPVEFPVCTIAQRAGERDVLGEPWPVGDALADVPAADPLDAVVLRRGSQRLMDASKSLPLPTLEWSMRAAMRGIDVPHWVVVHAVDGVEPGVYKWNDGLELVRAGRLREKLGRVALDQNLAAEAAFVAVSAIDLARLDDRSYRAAQLGAGIVEGRLHLAAYALGAGASGMTFADTEIPELVGDPAVSGLLFTCVGVPEYKSKPGGGPGAPVTVRYVSPRIADEAPPPDNK
jgi:hypothetical protein